MTSEQLEANTLKAFKAWWRQPEKSTFRCYVINASKDSSTQSNWKETTYPAWIDKYYYCLKEDLPPEPEKKKRPLNFEELKALAFQGTWFIGKYHGMEMVVILRLLPDKKILETSAGEEYAAGTFCDNYLRVYPDGSTEALEVEE